VWDSTIIRWSVSCFPLANSRFYVTPSVSTLLTYLTSRALFIRTSFILVPIRIAWSSFRTWPVIVALVEAPLSLSLSLSRCIHHVVVKAFASNTRWRHCRYLHFFRYDAAKIASHNIVLATKPVSKPSFYSKSFAITKWNENKLEASSYDFSRKDVENSWKKVRNVLMNLIALLT